MPVGTVQVSCVLSARLTKVVATDANYVPPVRKHSENDYYLGYYCPNTGMSSFTPCPNGQFSGKGAAACTNCPKGHHCPNSFTTPVQCPPGSYAIGNDLSSVSWDGIFQQCVVCPQGSYCAALDNFPTALPTPAGPGNLYYASRQ